MALRHGGDGAWMRLSAAACYPPLNALSHVLTKLAWGHKATRKSWRALWDPRRSGGATSESGPDDSASIRSRILPGRA